MANQTHISSKMRVRGAALIMVILSLAMISAVVVDLMVDQTSSYKIALRHRDALKAEALAQSGLRLGEMFLVVQSGIQPFFTNFAEMGVPLPQTTVWDMLPVDSNLFQGLSSGDLPTTFGIDVSEALDKRKEEEKEKRDKILQEKEEKTRAVKGTFLPPDGGFGAFEGTFTVKITDEESKISFRRWTELQPAERNRTRKLLESLMLSNKYNYLFKEFTRADMIANIYDYLDADEIRIDPNAIGDNWGQPFGGSESELYLGEKGVKPKNAYFDSLEELYLVPGFTNRHYQLFAPSLTIYGQDKINILSAKEPVIEALVRFCAKNQQDPLIFDQKWVEKVAENWTKYKQTGGGPVSVKGFIGFLQKIPLPVDAKGCEDALGVESKNFTLKSQATIGDVTRSFTLVTRVSRGEPERYYFRGQ